MDVERYNSTQRLQSVPGPTPSKQPSHVPAAEYYSIIDQLNPDSFQKAFELAGVQVAGEYSVEMLLRMPQENLRGIIAEQQNWLENNDEPILQAVEQLQELSSTDLNTDFRPRTSFSGKKIEKKTTRENNFCQ